MSYLLRGFVWKRFRMELRQVLRSLGLGPLGGLRLKPGCFVVLCAAWVPDVLTSSLSLARQCLLNSFFAMQMRYNTRYPGHYVTSR